MSVVWAYFRTSFFAWFTLIFVAASGVPVLGTLPMLLHGTARGKTSAAVSIAIFVPCLTLFLWQAGKVWRSVTAIRRGPLAAGKVVNISLSNVTVNNEHRYHVEWQATTLDGRTIRGKSPPLTQVHANRWKPGSPISVCLHPNRPEWGEADVFGFRSPVPW